ncbi:MAG: MGMT family protein [Euryarchaeota archaeon]|nr:MGMT family protein [Euryarchaeota archaeon]MDE1837308.1 MGMT family protein [Euryarchaeota archaeon]MDE1879820.1 MGMT family protein [Euryarchaeota archaeon]MDE2045261.1 MGMT family protein [Thermoplasmata archaeon]
MGRVRAESHVDFEARVVEAVREIPFGRVCTYGDIDRRAPRRVGAILATTLEDIPWHRVVRADGTLAMGRRQEELLLQEGVPISHGRVDLARARYSAGRLDR